MPSRLSLGFVLLVIACGSESDPGQVGPSATGGSGNTGPVTNGTPGSSCDTMLGTECQGESCCTNTLVTGGTLMMGRGESPESADYYPDGFAIELPEHSVTVADFYLDKYEATVGRFRAFLDSGAWVPAEGAGAHPRIAGTGWQSAWNAELPTNLDEWSEELDCTNNTPTWTVDASGDETLAINCLTWYAAMAFCIWDGGRLPTEAEWEYAAAGGGENRLYPWGSEAPSCSVANMAQCLVRIDAVGTAAGVGRWEHRDLAGNASEWTFDAFALDWYSQPAATGTDVANTTTTTERGARGGGFTSIESGLRSAARRGFPPATPLDYAGVRCAR